MGLDIYFNASAIDENKKKHEKEVYFRKVNFLISWANQNLLSDDEEEVENCKEYEVKLKQLVDLKNSCSSLLKLLNKKGLTEETIEECKMELPTQDGFFFGTTTYDIYYVEDLKYCKNEISKLITFCKKYNTNATFYAWW